MEPLKASKYAAQRFRESIQTLGREQQSDPPFCGEQIFAIQKKHEKRITYLI